MQKKRKNFHLALAIQFEKPAEMKFGAGNVSVQIENSEENESGRQIEMS
jgi:hypothetical protein